MTPVFWILVAIWLIFVWAVSSFAFKKIGKYIKDLIDDVKNNTKDSEDENG